jgi:hypothetical protein
MLASLAVCEVPVASRHFSKSIIVDETNIIVDEIK